MIEVIFTKSALKALKRMPANTAKRIRAKIDRYAVNPESLANTVSALRGSDYILLRVGDYRVIMLEDGTVLEIIAIGARGGIYE